MTTRTLIPGDYDPQFIAARAGTSDNYGHETQGSEILLVYPVSKFDAVQAAIADYPVSHLDIELPALVAEIADIRRAKVEQFSFNGTPIALDPETRANLTGAALGLTRCPDVTGIDWQVQPGVFATLPAPVVLAMADAAFRYVQACFTHARILSEQAAAASNIFDLRAIDVQAGWPS